MSLATVDQHGACARCGQNKAVAEFSKTAHYCRPCVAAYAREWRAKHPERNRANSARFRSTPENREKARQRTAVWRTADPARARASERRWHTENRESHRAAKQAWKVANKEKVAASNAASRLRHRDARNATGKRWREEHPEHWRELRRGVVARRRALKKGAAWVEHVKRDIVWERDGRCCAICGLPVEFADMHVDHIIPLCRGGEHSYRNVQAAHAACNMAKGRR